MVRFRANTVWTVTLLVASCVTGGSQRSLANDEPIRFNNDIRPIFAKHCVACHGGVHQAGGLSFVYKDNVLAGGDSGQPAVAPGDVESSYLIDRVTDSDDESRMPPAEHGPPLSAAEVELLKRWIRAGAPWEPPWSHIPPRQTPQPDVQQSNWCRKSLDYYVLERLEAAERKPEPAAERAEWLRRATFDLVGLPPSIKDLESFEADRRPDAYEHVVDRLLASPHFGERWAAVWLDLARYADTTGYEQDRHRDIWPYRDWVIRAFNSDMPYDTFTVNQLAGDLLDSLALDDLVATAFHRNTQTNSEGGTDDEEFRVAAVVDRVNTTWQVWQATTFGCVQCHSHPYDPFRHDEYYQFLAIFNNTRDTDVEEEIPRLSVPLDPEDFPEAADIEQQRSRLRRELYDQVKPLAEDVEGWRTLRVDTAKSTGNTSLRIEKQSPDGEETAADVIAEGTVTTGSKFTIESPVPADLDQISALRIDAFTRDAESARRTPEIGFVLSNLDVELLPPGGCEPIKLRLSHAFGDEAEPLLDPDDSLRDDVWGWASYSRQWRPHYAVFLLEKPCVVPTGSRLRLTLAQDRGTIGDAALVISRSRYSVSSSRDWIDLQQSCGFIAARAELADLTRRQKEIPSTSIPVMRELPPGMQRSTFVFVRGLWLDKGDEVQPKTPEALPPLPVGVEPDRLAIARWLVSDDNPLTARVMVNRVWEQLFGVGIVETTEDFGTAGMPPSHPELLDHLALRFKHEHNWSLKQLLRELVLSATYRQSSRTTESDMAADPQNRLHSHGPRLRLSAEMIRDQALVLSGRFAPTMYGPPVMPPQPDGIWRSVYSDAKWKTAEDENRYRRAIYTYWKRTSAYPSMATFDVPSREVCTSRRIVTNTPLQALVTLNDEAYVECAAGLADRMMTEAGDSTDERVAWAYRAATGRSPTRDTVADLARLYQIALREFVADQDASQPSAITAKRAAMSIVASAILNLDEVLSK